MEFCEVSEKEFADFSEKSVAGSFLQSLEMYRRYQNRKNEVYLVGLREGKKLLAASLIVAKRRVLGKKVFIAPRGFMADFKSKNFPEVLNEFTKGAKLFLKPKGGCILEIAPNYQETAKTDEKGVPTGSLKDSKIATLFQENDYKALGEYEFVKWEYVLDTSKLEADQLLSHIRSGHRYATRLALERYNMRLRELKIDELKVLKDLSEEAAKRHGFITPSIEYYKEMKTAFKDQVKFYVAEIKESVLKAAEEKREIAEIKKIAFEKPKKTDRFIPVAAAMFIFTPKETIYLYSGSSTKYNNFGGPHFMQYEMIKKTIELNIPTYNFYGTNPVAGDGVYEFKRGYHGELKEYLGTFILPLDLRGKIFALKQKYQEIRDLH